MLVRVFSRKKQKKSIQTGAAVTMVLGERRFLATRGFARHRKLAEMIDVVKSKLQRTVAEFPKAPTNTADEFVSVSYHE